MKFAGRIAAAIEILVAIEARHQPAADALRDWGKAHRFAGSSDRHVIGTLVYDSLRNKLAAQDLLQDVSPRAVVLGTLKLVWEISVAEIADALADKFGAGALTPAEESALKNNSPNAKALANLPDFLHEKFAAVFGATYLSEAAALCVRAPIDLRVNLLKTTREKLLERFEKFSATPVALSPTSVRIAAPKSLEKSINIEAETAHGMGWFEVQDTASQIAAQLVGAKSGERILDLCAGAGGKTLALASFMKNQGTLYAYDSDKHRLRPIFERVTRAGANNIEVFGADEFALLEKNAPFDKVVVDAPCTGSGTWRRKADAKWRLQEKQILQRIEDQRSVLLKAAQLVKNGGEISYFTCSLLAEENTQQVAWFLEQRTNFKLLPIEQEWQKYCEGPVPHSADNKSGSLLLSPYQHNTDGFFVAKFIKIA